MMENLVSAIAKAAEVAVTTLPTGRKLENPDTSTMLITGKQGDPASILPDTSTLVGTIDSLKISAAPDDPNREPLSPWTDLPTWLTSVKDL